MSESLWKTDCPVCDGTGRVAKRRAGSLTPARRRRRAARDCAVRGGTGRLLRILGIPMLELLA